jgi:ADP-ribose pyrophosphatase YjhB (NUDIX family)
MCMHISRIILLCTIVFSYMQGGDMDEMIEVLDDNGTVLHTALRSQVMRPDFVNFKLVSAFIRDAHGNFIMFRRAYHKSRYGGKFGAVGGCVAAGESYYEALCREVQEEIGIDVTTHECKLLGYVNPKQDNTIGHVAVYEIVVSEIIDYEKDDFAEMRHFTLQELKALCNANTEVTHNLPIYVHRFF